MFAFSVYNHASCLLWLRFDLLLEFRLSIFIDTMMMKIIENFFFIIEKKKEQSSVFLNYLSLFHDILNEKICYIYRLK